MRATWAPRIVTVLGGAGIGALWWLLDGHQTLVLRLTVVDVLLFLAAAVVMERLPIRLASGRGVATSTAVIGAAALLGASPPVAAAIAATAYALACALGRQQPELIVVLRRAIAAWTLCGLAAVGAALGPATWSGSVDGAVPAALNLGAAAALGLGVLVGVPSVETLTGTGSTRGFTVRRILEEINRYRLVGTSVVTTAALGALVQPVLGAWTLPTMLLPLAAARVGLDRLAQGQRAYDQTIRAMSRLPEQLGTVAEGHGLRVGALAREVALELGLDAATVAETVRAAYLHEVGRIRLEREGPALQHEVAAAGAQVLREVGDLDRVAAIVEAQVAGHRTLSDEVGQPARIVLACCVLDSYAPDEGDAAQRHEVIVRLVHGVGDIEVVAALARVVDRAADGVPA